ncbi:MAG: DnaJ domain-containing protein [Dehalococcoidales bacterium]|jgi:curved DNA-binding protein CbpA
MKPELDYYTILQVDPRAEPEVIQAAYRRLAAKYHPDVDSSFEAEERMKLLNAAYEVLSDTGKRREHDISWLRSQQKTKGNASTGQRSRWFLLLAAVVFLILLRFNIRLLLVAVPVFLLLGLYLNWKGKRK